MTALCGGGTSAPKTGLPSVIDPAITLIAELLAAKGGKWVLGALGFQLVEPVNVSSFCAGDPPSLPTFTSDETEAILKLIPGVDFISGIAKLKDWIQHVLWYELCECTSGTLATYTAPSIPSGTPEYYPPVPNIAEPCGGQAITGPYPVTAGNTFFAGYLNAVADAGKPITSGHVTMVVAASTGNFNVTVEVRTQTNTPITAGPIYSYSLAPGTYTRDIPFSPLYPLWACYLIGAAGTGQRLVDVDNDFYCNGETPGNANSPCCPPDVSTQAALDLILKMVTLVQRQVAPFAYVYGDNHTSLSGDGELSPVSGLIGVSVDVTALAPSVGEAMGTPTHLFDAGFVTLGTPDGWLRPRRIDADGTLELAPNGAGALTRIGYTLAPGVTADIRELVREP